MGKANNIILLILGSWLSVTCITGSGAEECDLTEVHRCVGASTDLLPEIYFRPLSTDLIQTINQHVCNKGIDTCLSHTVGNCSNTELAPYRTVVNTVNFVCHTSLDMETSCLGQKELQHALGFCFQVFKVVIDNVVSDPSLDQSGVNEGMCNAYVDVSSCSVDASLVVCDTRSQMYIATFLNAITRATRSALGCMGL